MQTDTRIALEGMMIGLYRAGVLGRSQVESVLHTMETHAQDSRSLSSAMDIERLLVQVLDDIRRREDAPSEAFDEDGFLIDA